MRIVYACNQMIRRYGDWEFFTDLKLLNGVVRNNWNVCSFSDLDVAKFTERLEPIPAQSQ